MFMNPYSFYGVFFGSIICMLLVYVPPCKFFLKSSQYCLSNKLAIESFVLVGCHGVWRVAVYLLDSEGYNRKELESDPVF